MQQGLSQAGVPAPQDQERAMIDEIKQMLLQGMDPQEMVQQGIPQELIQIAIQELEQEMGPQGQQAPQEPVTQAGQGLAAQAAY